LAVTKATHYVHDAIEKSLGVIGRGTGPLNHFHNFQPVAYSGYEDDNE
jgi:hydroxymethylpyrimidine/phosphomethylpyrimidine kinase